MEQKLGVDRARGENLNLEGGWCHIISFPIPCDLCLFSERSMIFYLISRYTVYIQTIYCLCQPPALCCPWHHGKNYNSCAPQKEEKEHWNLNVSSASSPVVLYTGFQWAFVYNENW